MLKIFRIYLYFIKDNYVCVMSPPGCFVVIFCKWNNWSRMASLTCDRLSPKRLCNVYHDKIGKLHDSSSSNLYKTISFVSSRCHDITTFIQSIACTFPWKLWHFLAFDAHVMSRQTLNYIFAWLIEYLWQGKPMSTSISIDIII